MQILKILTVMALCSMLVTSCGMDNNRTKKPSDNTAADTNLGNDVKNVGDAVSDTAGDAVNNVTNAVDDLAGDNTTNK